MDETAQRSMEEEKEEEEATPVECILSVGRRGGGGGEGAGRDGGCAWSLLLFSQRKCSCFLSYMYISSIREKGAAGLRTNPRKYEEDDDL